MKKNQFIIFYLYNIFMKIKKTRKIFYDLLKKYRFFIPFLMIKL